MGTPLLFNRFLHEKGWCFTSWSHEGSSDLCQCTVYEPTTTIIQTKFKALFVVFSQHDINYSFLKDFNNKVHIWLIWMSNDAIDNQVLTFLIYYYYLSFLLQQARSMPIGNTSLRSPPSNANITMVTFPKGCLWWKVVWEERERERE